MRLNSLYCYTLACVVWLILQATAPPATALRAQSPADSPAASSSTATNAWHFQYDLFQLLLERQGLAPVSTADEIFVAPAKSVIVIAGDPRGLPTQSLIRLSQFVQEGGALLLATDKQTVVPDIARFMAGNVVAGDARNSYQGFADCVRVTAIAQDSPLSGVAMIVTNRSGWLQVNSRGPFSWEAVASFPDDCLPKQSRGQPLLAIGHPDARGGGLIVLSADASLFTNGMLWHGDNAILAIRITSLLAGAGRTRLAFWVDGQRLSAASQRIEDLARAGQPNAQLEQPLPEPELDKVLKLANAVASEVGRSNVLNETLMQRPRNVRPSRYFRFLLILAAVALFVVAVWILVTSGGLRPFASGAKRRAERAARNQRNHPANAARDYRAPAGYLAREFCWELTGSRQSTDWQAYLARQLVFEPVLSPSDQQELARIIDIASRGCRERMVAFDFQQLGRTIAALRAKYQRDAPASGRT